MYSFPGTSLETSVPGCISKKRNLEESHFQFEGNE